MQNQQNPNRTLADVIQGSHATTEKHGSNESYPDTSTTQSFNTFLSVYSINLSYRFPDINDLNSIDYQQIREIADFSAACSSVALETWQELQQSTMTDKNRRQRIIARQSRIA